MRLREKGKKGGEPITMGWDEAQNALAAGTHEVAQDEGSEKSGADALDADKPTPKPEAKASGSDKK